MKIFFSLFLGAVLVSTSFSISFAASVPTSTKQDQVDRRLKSVKALLNTSSIARKVKSSKSKGAKKLHQNAIELHKKAALAFKKSDYKLTVSLLIKAEQTMFKAVKLTDFSKSSNKKKKRDFDHRLKTLRGLIEAHKTVSAEKGLDKSSIVTKANKTLDKANALVKAGKIDLGRKELDKAYHQVTESVKSMRKGEVKARLLVFKTKKDEYIFVRRYNDDYVKLVANFIEELKNNSGSPKLISRLTGYQKSGKKIRKDAQSLAASKKFEKAIVVIEKSTREFKKALRALGFPIH